MIKIVLCICTAAAVVLLGYLAVQIRDGWRMVRELSHPKRAAAPNVSEFDCFVHFFRFASTHGRSLSAVVYEPRAAVKRRGTILAFHYLGGSKTSIYPYVKNLIDHGYRVASFDYPNHGESGDSPSSRYTLETDVRYFLEALRRNGMDGPYGAMGFSMGASLALAAADFEPQIKAVALDSGPLLDARRYFYRVLDGKREKRPVVRFIFVSCYLFLMGFYSRERKMMRRLKRLRGLPMLYVHGKRDRIIPIDSARHAYELSKSEFSRFTAVDRAHHLTNRVLLGPQYDQLVLDFFRSWLQ